MEKSDIPNKKSGKGSIIIIVLLVLIILGLCGYICYEKGVFEKLGITKEKTEEKNSKTTDSDKDYSTAKAKELIDKYYVEMLWDNIYTDETGYDGMTKDVVTINNIVNSKKKIGSCFYFYENNPNAIKDGQSYSVKLNSSEFSIKTGGGCDTGTADYYEYKDLNSVYKDLFGKDQEMPKSDFSKWGRVFDYMEDKDVFVQLDCRCGGAEGPHYRNYFVQNAKVKGDTLTVNVGYVSMKASDNDPDDPMLSATIKGEEVSYKYSETNKDTFEKEFTDKYLDKLDSYEFTFKYDDDHYVFVKMEKK